MHRFLCPNADFTKSSIQITDSNEIHHIKNVLRFKEGDKLSLFNGKGKEAEGKIFKITDNSIHLSIQSMKEKAKKLHTLVLACAIPKKSKFEFIIEKCTELGVDEIIPLITHRTEFKVDQKRGEAKIKRYQTVAANAAKQSKRTTVPIIHPLTKFKDIFPSPDNDSIAFIPCLSGERIKITDALGKATDKKRLLFLIGPEGDFTEEELKEALKQNCIPISLGPTTLKVDTAAISAVALANLFFDT